MKATFVLIANNDIENYGRRLMLQAHKAGNLGFEMARLPQHVSLKQPFSIPELKSIEEYFDRFVKEIKPVKIQFEGIDVSPSSVFGYASGVISLRVSKTKELENIQKKLFRELNNQFGDCPAEHDDDYIFHMTIAIGGAPYENYLAAFDILNKQEFNREAIFDKLGLLYYDDDHITPGTYFCYKVKSLEG